MVLYVYFNTAHTDDVMMTMKLNYYDEGSLIVIAHVVYVQYIIQLLITLVLIEGFYSLVQLPQAPTSHLDSKLRHLKTSLSNRSQ